ncbi:Sensor histidine kinase TmoS [Planctomycetes bacterium Poly30]|uniref:histidine kinase n=1 Tax=Saltatorellus ferox TaxID=2528018 RepID=A0A518EY62_9BACT|nr:Sensor histidine kinase TmoS [Planctomycetes bacterium Poly30]
MSLSTKIAAILTALILSLSIVGGFVQNRAFSSLFENIETAEADKDLRRVKNAIRSEVDEVSRIAQTYAVSDPAAEFLQDARSRPGFVQEHLTPRKLQGAAIDLLFFCDLDGRVMASQVIEPKTGEPIDLLEFPRSELSPSHALLSYFAAGSPDVKGIDHSGILSTEKGPLLASSQVVTGEGVKKRGYVIVGRFLRDGLSDRVEQRTEVEFAAWQLDRKAALPPDVAAVFDEVTSSPAPILETSGDGKSLSIYASIDGLRGIPELIIRAKVDRDITAAGKTALLSGAITDATLGLVILLALLYIVNRVVLKPVKALTDHAVRTGLDENFRAKFGMEREDEIGVLASEFDQMMAKLEQARSALVETARTAGMSEIATGILHNVGNVLNSVNISASLVSQRVDGLCIDDLERLSEVLTENKEDLPRFLAEDPRGQHIQPFLSALVVQLAEEQKCIRTEVTSLSDGIDHICELIKSQQSLAKGTKLVEPTDLSERVDEALRITQRVQGVDPELVVVRRYDDLQNIKLDKHKLLEILVNLVQNARQAMYSVSGPRELILEIRAKGEDQVFIAVQDSGIGIEKDDLTRVFNMGFTTREEGHGFGLHSSVNAATEMGGRLYATSEGRGRGARFVLELPMNPPGASSEEREAAERSSVGSGLGSGGAK